MIKKSILYFSSFTLLFSIVTGVCFSDPVPEIQGKIDLNLDQVVARDADGEPEPQYNEECQGVLAKYSGIGKIHFEYDIKPSIDYDDATASYFTQEGISFDAAGLEHQYGFTSQRIPSNLIYSYRLTEIIFSIVPRGTNLCFTSEASFNDPIHPEIYCTIVTSTETCRPR